MHPRGSPEALLEPRRKGGRLGQQNFLQKKKKKKPFGGIWSGVHEVPPRKLVASRLPPPSSPSSGRPTSRTTPHSLGRRRGAQPPSGRRLRRNWRSWRPSLASCDRRRRGGWRHSTPRWWACLSNEPAIECESTILSRSDPFPTTPVLNLHEGGYCCSLIDPRTKPSYANWFSAS
jgi:hypothetical protein